MVPPHQGTHLSILATANKKPPPPPSHLGDIPPPQERDGGATTTSLVFPTPVRAGQLSWCLEGFHPADRVTLSVIGTLNFACAVILPGQAFPSQLIDLTIGVSKPYYFNRITREVWEDLRMSVEFLVNFNGRTIFMAKRWLLSTSLNLFTGSSGTLGYGQCCAHPGLMEHGHSSGSVT